ncbi:MAG: hypothetical protein LBO20_05540 [Bifidobacteriaceae bacterium]|nr:hypothetical protein [Bifidobacteriaceae bacterium]
MRFRYLGYPIAKFPPEEFPGLPDLAAAPVGADLTEALGVVLWQPPLPVSMAGELVVFSRRVPKSDEERIHNIPQVLEVMDAAWVAIEKIDGTSTTFALDQDGFTLELSAPVVEEMAPPLGQLGPTDPWGGIAKPWRQSLRGSLTGRRGPARRPGPGP